MGSITGSCKRCGYCCRNIQFTLPADAAEWAKARGLDITQINEQWLELRIPQECINLKDGLCGVQEDKPGACRGFPHSMINFWERHGMDPVVSLGPACGFKYVKDGSSGDVPA